MSEDQQFILDFIAELRKYECLCKIDQQASKISLTKAYEWFRKCCKLDRKYYDPLWKIEHQSFKKATAAEAYENLRKFCEKSNQPATLQYVRDTIINLRSTFNREFLLELNSLAKGAKEIYKSDLYYYKAMFFMIVLNAPPGFKWKDEEVSNIEREDEDQTRDTEPVTIASNKQLMDVTTAHKLSYDTQREHKKIAQNKENTDDLLKERETNEIDNIGENEEQIVDDCDFRDDSTLNLSTPESPRPANERLDDETTPSGVSFDTQKRKKVSNGQTVDTTSSRISSNTQKRKRIVNQQSADVGTASRISNTRKRRKLNKSKEYTEDLFKVACSKLTKETDEFDSTGNNVAAKLRSLDASQRIIAEKLISDILYHAQMNTLTPNTLLS